MHLLAYALEKSLRILEMGMDVLLIEIARMLVPCERPSLFIGCGTVEEQSLQKKKP